MQRIKRLLAALIGRHAGDDAALADDRARADELCASGALTAAEYAAIIALLPAAEGAESEGTV